MNTNRPLALVTGASSGIGTELALELARTGHDLILTGRDAGRLNAAADRVRAAGAAVETLTLDLGDPAAVAALMAHLGSRSLAVLVNNAGFGLSGAVAEASPAELSALLALNVTTLTMLTRAVLPGMVARKAGRILNLASTAAFGPIPGMAVYAASKSYVLSFTEALAVELEGTGVTVTALCPGPTKTRFADRASLEKSKLFQNGMEAPAVAKLGLRALLKGRTVRTAGLANQLLTFSARLAPRKLTARIAGRMTKTN